MQVNSLAPHSCRPQSLGMGYDAAHKQKSGLLPSTRKSFVMQDSSFTEQDLV